MLPRPEPTAELGEGLDARRRELMLGRAWGLTATYNTVFKPVVTDTEVGELRENHTEIDHAALTAYGWNDIYVEPGHYDTKIGTRWTLNDSARHELLDRLLAEDHRSNRSQ